MNKAYILRFIFGCLILAFLLQSCARQKPEGLIQEESFAKVLTDIQITEAMMQDLIGPEKDSIAKIYYDQIFQTHHITRKNFEITMDYYSHRPEDFKRLSQKVLNDLKDRQKNISK